MKKEMAKFGVRVVTLSFRNVAGYGDGGSTHLVRQAIHFVFWKADRRAVYVHSQFHAAIPNSQILIGTEHLGLLAGSLTTADQRPTTPRMVTRKLEDVSDHRGEPRYAMISSPPRWDSSCMAWSRATMAHSTWPSSGGWVVMRCSHRPGAVISANSEPRLRAAKRMIS